MEKLPGKIGKIRKELEGAPCPSCGCSRYHLVLRPRTGPTENTLFGECSRCQRRIDMEDETFQAWDTKASQEL